MPDRPVRLPERAGLRRAGRVLHRAVLAAAVGLAAVAAWAVITFVVRENLDTVIAGELYRSGQPSPRQLAGWVDDLGLRGVLRLKGAGRTLEPERRVLEERGVELRQLRLSGQRAPTTDELAALLRELESAPRPLLVHCDAGADRTALATSLALLLAGADIERASAQFSLRYRHLGAWLGSPLADVLGAYASWLEASGTPHSPERLRHWAAHVYVPGYYRADIRAASWSGEAEVGQRLRLRVSVTNTSPRAIPLGRDASHAVGLRAVLSPGPGGGREAARSWWVDGPPAALAPGSTRDFDVDVPLPDRPGEYELLLDLAEDDGSGDLRWFAAMGSQPFRTGLRVVAPARPDAG